MAGKKTFLRSDVLIPALSAFPKLAFLATSPQNPDGAELVTTAVYGGVLHPPGFPLQAWIDRAVVSIFSNAPVLSLSALSWFFHLLTCVILFQTLLRLRVRTLEATFALLLFSYFPSVFDQSVQPEKYSLLLLLFVAAIYCGLRVTQASTGSKEFWWLNLCTILGLGFAQHALALAFAPACVLAALSMGRSDGTKPRVWLTGACAAILPPALFYLSLPLLRGSAIWPDFGKLASLQNIFAHVFLPQHGFFKSNSLMSFSDAESVNASDLLLAALASRWNLALLLPPFGVVRLFRQNVHALLLLLSILFPTLVFLLLFNLPAVLSTRGYLERYGCLAIPVLAILSGIGLKELLGRLKQKKWRRAVAVLAFGIPSFQITHDFPRYLAFHSHLQDGFRSMVADELRADAIFMSEDAYGLHYGYPSSGGKVRFALADVFSLSWYLEEAAPKLEPRILPFIAKLKTLPSQRGAELLRLFDEQGVPIITTESRILDPFRDHEKARGFVFISERSAEKPISQRNLVLGLKACQWLNRERFRIPSDAHFFTQERLLRYKGLFLQMAQYLSDQNRGSDAEVANGLAESLGPDVSPDVWHEKCRLLTRQTGSL